MPAYPFHLSRIAAAAALLALTACGGGGSGGGGGFPVLGGGTTTPSTPTTPSSPQPTPDTPAPAAPVLRGVAATGAAFAGAKLEVIDQRGQTVCSVTTDGAGGYSCELPAGTTAPLLLRAQRDEQTLYSLSANAQGGTLNVTPLTTIVAAQLAADGNPASLAQTLQTDPTKVSDSAIRAEVQALMAVLEPLLQALGQAGLDPFGGTLVADGTGQDRVLDAITVSVRPDGAAANIEITVKAPTADGAPLSVQYRTSDEAVATLPPVTAEQLAAVPMPAQVAEFFQRLDACFALPLTQRVSTAANDQTDATGTAADVTGSACRTLFVDDNPATYVANGVAVGRDAQGRGAWSSLFRPGPTGLRHDRSNFEFFRTSGGQNDLVLSYRWTDVQGNTDNETLVVRNQDGKLKLTGNSYAYRATVRPVSEDREYLNMPDYNAFTTGYNISIDNRPDLDHVMVTTPWNQQIKFSPSGNLSYMVAHNANDQQTVTSIVRLAAGYSNPATAGNLADKEASIYFVNPQYSEIQIRTLQDHGVWKMEFFPVSGSPVVQTYRTLARAQTIDEVRQLKFAQLTAAQRAELLVATAANGRITFGAPSDTDPNNIDFSSEGGGDAWTVPDGALAPTSFSVTGRVGAQGSARFNDSTLVRNAARKVVLYCSPQSQADTHCVMYPAGSGYYQYAQGSSFNAMELWARSARQVEMKKQIGLYKGF